MFDKMIADMLGISPAEMQEMLTGMQTLLKDGVSKLNEIHEQNAQILAYLTAKGNPDNVE